MWKSGLLMKQLGGFNAHLHMPKFIKCCSRVSLSSGIMNSGGRVNQVYDWGSELFGYVSPWNPKPTTLSVCFSIHPTQLIPTFLTFPFWVFSQVLEIQQ